MPGVPAWVSANVRSSSGLLMLRARREHGQGIGEQAKATDLTKSLFCDRHRIILGDTHPAHEEQNTHFSPKGMGYCVLLCMVPASRLLHIPEESVVFWARACQVRC